MVARAREGGQLSERFFLLREPHCRGHHQDRRQTVREWLADQDLGAYNRMNDLLMALISLKRRLAPGPLTVSLQGLFYHACYDLDAFRARLRTSRPGAAADPPSQESLAGDDDALLTYALDYWQKALAGPTSRWQDRRLPERGPNQTR
jgi:hypothetical protein